MAIRILILEDKLTDAELVEREVRRTGLDFTMHRVVTRSEYERALREEPPDLIVSDHNLPQFTGREALELGKALAPEAPFVLVTGSLSEETAVEYMKAGAANYILKDRIARLGPAVVGALEQARQRRTLSRQEKLIREVIDANPNLIFVKDWDGRFVLANRATAELYGTTVDAIVGKTDADFNPKQDEVEHFLHDDREVMSSGQKKWIPEEPVTNPATGTTRWFQTTKVPLILSDRDSPLLLGVATEITERKRLEQQLLQAQKMEAVGRLAGGIAHDFNNLLTAVMGNAELLREEIPSGDPRRDDVEEIKRAAERAAGLTRQLLAFSRQQVLEPKVLDLTDLVAGTEKLLQRIIGEDIEFITVLPPETGRVRADPGQLEQVILNLAVNARDAMPKGGRLTIETANAELDEAYARRHGPVKPGRYVMLAVSDTGIGMDQDTQARIFEPFFTTKEAGKGTGLGLATVYGIVKQSEGNIWVYSELGKGTTFKVYLPRVEQPAERLAPGAPSPEPRRGSETILVVEDEESVRALTRRVLAGYGYRVLVATNVDEAVRLAEGHEGTVHLLLTDVVMPKMSGRELAERLAPQRPAMKVLYLSGYTADAIVHHGVLEPGVAFLQKPFTPDTLARKVRQVLDGKLS